jgi:hypothetical protein
VQPAAVVRKSDHGLFAGEIGEIAQVDATEAGYGVDDSADGFDTVPGAGVAGFGVWDFEFVEHGDAERDPELEMAARSRQRSAAGGSK